MCWSRHPECVTYKHMTVLLVPCGSASWNSLSRVLSQQTDGDQFQFCEEAKPRLANNCLHTPTLCELVTPAHTGHGDFLQRGNACSRGSLTNTLLAGWTPCRQPQQDQGVNSYMKTVLETVTCLTIQTSADSIIGSCQILWKEKDAPLCHLFSPPLSQRLKNPMFPSLILSFGVLCLKKKMSRITL